MPCVWISRPAARATELSDALRRCGIATLNHPALEITALDDDTVMQHYLKTATDFALSIFVSADAAERIAKALPVAAELPPMAALAIGVQTARALSPRYELRNAPTAAISDSAALLQLPILRQPPERIAVLGGGASPSPQLCDTLRRRGADVVAVPCYERRACSASPALLAAAERGDLDAAVAYSADTLRFMLAMTAPHNDWLRRLPLFVIHANIAEQATAWGFHRVLVNDAADTATAVADYFHRAEPTPSAAV